MVVKRRYESKRRQQQAHQTRRVILEAADRLFVRSGYPATTLAAVAAGPVETGAVRADHDADGVADVLWLAMDLRDYDWLVRERGRPVQRLERWYVDTVAAAVLD
ncbi:hypothetical protein [Streptosporangium vulgare]|uniref:HTH tetR-type domain-containing protein n=1 Tax=Streptosporangium vulgare TaxID=46190 RepID=A0ABV5TRQ8_9ACTN